MKFMRQMLSDNRGMPSSLRVMSLACIIAAIILAMIGILKPVVDYSGLSLLCGTFLGAGFGGKIAQKKTEVTAPNP